MACKKESETNVIDLKDYVNPEPGCVLERMQQAFDQRGTDRPCEKLSWCPYGLLVEAFPTSYHAAKARGLSTGGLPLDCTFPIDESHHCPAFYLATSGCGPGHFPPVNLPKDGPDDCYGCKKELLACPKGAKWRRRFALHVARNSETDDYWIPQAG